MKRSVAVAVLLVTVAVAASIAWGINSRDSTKTTAGPVEYAATDLATGKRVSLADYRGSPVLLSSWATWCTECKEELPGLSKLWEARKSEGLVVIAVNIDLPGESRGINALIKKYSLTMPIWSDPNNLYSATFKALGVPTSVLLDSQGRLVKTWIGRIDFEDSEVDAAIEAVLAQ